MNLLEAEFLFLFPPLFSFYWLLPRRAAVQNGLVALASPFGPRPAARAAGLGAGAGGGGGAEAGGRLAAGRFARRGGHVHFRSVLNRHGWDVAIGSPPRRH